MICWGAKVVKEWNSLKKENNRSHITQKTIKCPLYIWGIYIFLCRD